jgi:hypothetical protein
MPLSEIDRSPMHVEQARQALEVCRACDGRGEHEIERYVTRDMACDACEPEMEGMPIPDHERCSECGGAGYIHDELIDALITAVRAEQEEITMHQLRGHWFTQGGTARFGALDSDGREPINADEFIVVMLDKLRALKAESGLLWATYRPQHHNDCTSGVTDEMGYWPHTDENGKPNAPCSCGLSALLAQLETP